jgi:3-carboxy-cis,cis-muconate cycloisomerase
LPSDERPDVHGSGASHTRAPVDVGLLSPVTVGFDEPVTDAAFLAALVTAEVALTRAWADAGAGEAKDEISARFGWAGAGQPCRTLSVEADALAEGSVAAGNPVIPLIAAMKAALDPSLRDAIHRGATSQDILDSAMMLLSRRAAARVVDHLTQAEGALAAFASAHRDQAAAARTLTQHAVPTTVGLRAANWLLGVRRARTRLEAVSADLPAQLGGAAGTLAALDRLALRDLGTEAAGVAEGLPAAFAAELGLAPPAAPWHTTRWPVTELGDALVQAIDAVGVLAADVATLSRTEIGELAEGAGGGSSAMPQKRNPTASVLIRSAAIRAPHLGATLHTASALAVDERPDGPWHAEWPTLRELLRLALGATGNASGLVDGLTVDDAAVARNLALTGGLIVSERLSIELAPRIGKERLDEILAAALEGEDLRTLVDAALRQAGDEGGAGDLLDPAAYTGLAATLVDRAVEGRP